MYDKIYIIVNEHFEKAATALSKWWINIEMVSQWIMERAIVFGINSKELCHCN